MHQLNAEQSAALAARANREMARLSAAGTIFYPLIGLVVCFAAGYFTTYPAVFIALNCAIILLAGLRIALVATFDKWYAAGPVGWRRLFDGSLIATVATWTAISCWTLLDHGIGGLAIFAMLASVMMADQSITIYTVSRPLMAAVLAVLVLPHVATLLRVGEPATVWIALSTLLYGIYLWVTGCRLHASYWQGMRDGELLQLRAAELSEHRARLEAVVEARTASLAEAVRGLETKNEELETQRRRVETKNEEIEAKTAELERFTYTVSHDLKSPLITVRGFLNLLKQDVTAGNAERTARDIERIESAVQRMGQLLEQLLELSRIGRMVNPPEDIALSELIREAVVRIAGPIKERGVEVEIGDDLPLVVGDRARLLEAFQHLIANAVQFMGEEKAPSIVVGARQEQDAVMCSIRDNGLGIDPEDHDRVFGLFECLERGGSTGTGVGLALVKRIVEVHAGRVWIESKGEGHGTTVWLRLPAAAGS